jgi:hypothetical protein
MPAEEDAVVELERPTRYGMWKAMKNVDLCHVPFYSGWKSRIFVPPSPAAWAMGDVHLTSAKLQA